VEILGFLIFQVKTFTFQVKICISILIIGVSVSIRRGLHIALQKLRTALVCLKMLISWNTALLKILQTDYLTNLFYLFI